MPARVAARGGVERERHGLVCAVERGGVHRRSGRLGKGERHGLEVGRSVIRRAVEAQALLPPLARG